MIHIDLQGGRKRMAWRRLLEALGVGLRHGGNPITPWPVMFPVSAAVDLAKSVDRCVVVEYRDRVIVDIRPIERAMSEVADALESFKNAAAEAAGAAWRLKPPMGLMKVSGPEQPREDRRAPWLAPDRARDPRYRARAGKR